MTLAVEKYPTRIIDGMEARPIPSLMGKYYATADGRIFSVMHRVPLERVLTKSRGYLVMTTNLDGKYRGHSAHRLIAEAFHGPAPFPRAVVRHIDSNPANNAPSNLAWATQAENLADREARGTVPRGSKNVRAKLNEAAVSEILKVANPNRRNMSALARRFGVSLSAIWLVVNGRSWKHVPRHKAP